MQPTDLPLSLARVAVPTTPVMAQETRRAVESHEGRTPELAPGAAGNAHAHAAHAARTPLSHPAAAQDQTGNAAVAKAVKQAPAPVLLLPVAPK
ncbi:hypothetical protein [Amycolatopsis silviterrae]|uniref:Uncharacterized protein n=1 Tax=Amycolatopsis silviterrae TaxID=1656914 RepID=A0ABW5H395_9PSEU